MKNKFKINPQYLFLLVFLMIGLSFASVPLYDLFCRVTGFGGTIQKSEKPSEIVLNKSIKIRFDTTKNGNLPVSFKPQKNFHDIKIGEVDNIVFLLKNESQEAFNVISTFNTNPPLVGKYFQKLQCFCFENQAIKPNETREFNVAYYIDPQIVKDPATKRTSEITLSYSLFEVKETR